MGTLGFILAEVRLVFNLPQSTFTDDAFKFPVQENFLACRLAGIRDMTPAANDEGLFQDNFAPAVY